MGADGGYHYLLKSELQKGLSEEDITLFLKFINHSLFRDTWKEDDDVDVGEWESDLPGIAGTDWFRYPYGTDVFPKLHYHSEDVYTNPPEEVWYYLEFGYAPENQHRDSHYWWCAPLSWYVWGHTEEKDEQGWYKPLITIPTPDELEELVRITDWISCNVRPCTLETWT